MLRWEKKGRIFNPTEFALPANCSEYAQAPQALVDDSFVRVYFSTRSRDSGTTWLSHIGYADFSRDFTRVLAVADHEAIPLGGLGDFDEHGIFPMNVLRMGNKIFAYTGGIHRMRSVPIDGAIGLAVSDDNGETFIRYGPGPVLSPSLHEPFLIADPFTAVIDGTMHMWYIFGVRWVAHQSTGKPERIYKIGHATSSDGIEWNKEGRRIIEDVIDEFECQAMPTVFRHDGCYHMLFCYRNAFDFRNGDARSYRLGYARSADGTQWVREDDASGIGPSSDGWDSEMMCYPHVVKVNDVFFLLYNGNEFGRYGFGVAVLQR